MRQARADLEMIDAEWKAGSGAEVFHRKRDSTANNEQDRGAPRSIGKDGVDQREGNENCRECLRERGWIPGKTDRGCKNAGDGQPKHGFLPRSETAAGDIFWCHCV